MLMRIVGIDMTKAKDVHTQDETALDFNGERGRGR